MHIYKFKRRGLAQFNLPFLSARLFQVKKKKKTYVPAPDSPKVKECLAIIERLSAPYKK